MSDRLLRETTTEHGNAVLAAQQSVAVCDRTAWGRIQLTGGDRQTFLHNQSTNDLKTLKPGQGADTVFVTSTARTIDLATAYVLDEAVVVVVSPSRRESVLQWLDRYIFFGDKVTLHDITEQTAMFSLIGPESHALLKKLGVETLPDPSFADHCTHQLITLAGQEIRLAGGSGLALDGYTLIGEVAGAAAIGQVLMQAGAVPMGDLAWEQLRILQGRPQPDQELTEDYNAVEACLWQAISINKGCYIGQETIARLDTYQGVKQQIWGIRLSAAATPGSLITLNGEKVGVLTSVTDVMNADSTQNFFGLGYVRTKAGGAGLQVQVGEAIAELVEVPFLRRDRT